MAGIISECFLVATKTGAETMRFVTWLYIMFVGVIVLASLATGIVGPLLAACVAIILVLPPFWDRMKQKDYDTWPTLRGITSFVVGMAAFGFWASSYEKTPEGKAARLKMQQTEQSEASMEAAKVKAVKDTGRECLTKWDGSHRALVDAVEQRLRNPSSFEHIETSITPVDEKGQHRVVMRYRAENGFGGMNVEAVTASVEYDTCRLVQVSM